MRVTWITHFAMRDVCKHMCRNEPISGGWLESMKDYLQCNEEIKLTVICVDKDSRERVETFELNNVDYYYIGVKKRNYIGHFSNFYRGTLNRCVIKSNPDLIHIHGTEFPICLALNKESIERIPVCVSIQGLISVISERYYWGGLYQQKLPFLVGVPLWVQNQLAIRRGKWEKEILQRFHYFLGRTQWDYSHLKSINPQSYYLISSEPLRKAFCDKRYAWGSNGVERHTIFCAGGLRLPIKGFHNVLNAAKMILPRYPDLKIYITGNAPGNSIRNRLGYGRYIKKMIDKSGLKDRIIFTGVLSAEEMAALFSTTNCYVLSSSIENSPNTLCEAMRIGTPSIASFVGGVQDFVTDKENGLLYRFEEIEMMAEAISHIFDNYDDARRMSANARKTSEQFDSRGRSLIENYRLIIADKRRNMA